MPSDISGPDSVRLSRAVRHHLAVVLACVALGAGIGWGYDESSPTSYTSSARVLVNPSAGNPYAPMPVSVRQDELTSLETEAEVARSVEVMGAVAARFSGLSAAELAARVQVVVPPNTQVLEISFSSTDAAIAQETTDAVADAYLDNRARRFSELNDARVERLETQTVRVVRDLRAATAAAQVGTDAERAFQAELADALRNELVSMRAQRTALENSESPAGAVISPASSPREPGALVNALLPVGGGLAGLGLGCLLALLLERLRGVVRSSADVEESGLPVVAAMGLPTGRSRHLRRANADTAFQNTIRRLRANVLDLETGPHVIAVVPVGASQTDPVIPEVIGQSFAKAGKRVVLVQADSETSSGGRGLAQALVDEQLDPRDLLQPTQEPLLSVLPAGRFSARSRELLLPDRLRTVLSPLTANDTLVVIASSGTDTVDGETAVAASDLALVVVTVGRTRRRELSRIAQHRHGRALAALVVGRRRSGGPLTGASGALWGQGVGRTRAGTHPTQAKSITRAKLTSSKR
jgi:succinoglycan biosynthesis transport protein ExoP